MMKGGDAKCSRNSTGKKIGGKERKERGLVKKKCQRENQLDKGGEKEKVKKCNSEGKRNHGNMSQDKK